MSKRKLEERRRRNQELGALDRLNRCTYCKAPFVGVVVESFLSDGKFCSEDCLKAAEEQAQGHV